MHKLESEDNLLQAFHDFDTDHSGSISPEELASKLVELNISNSKEEVLAMINEVDTDHDGSSAPRRAESAPRFFFCFLIRNLLTRVPAVDYNEFVALMCPRLRASSASVLCASFLTHKPVSVGHKAEDVTTQNRNFKLRST